MASESGKFYITFLCTYFEEYASNHKTATVLASDEAAAAAAFSAQQGNNANGEKILDMQPTVSTGDVVLVASDRSGRGTKIFVAAPCGFVWLTNNEFLKWMQAAPRDRSEIGREAV